MEAQKQEEKKQSKKLLQWHPAFYAGIQMELQEEADNLIFENEHQLGTKPMGIDVLIIKKQEDKPIRKNIGRVFRKYNIIEYKGPGDYLTIDSFYKVYGYMCFYKSDVEKINSIKINELTVSYVCENYPRKMIRHLREERRYTVQKREAGIYEIAGDSIPMQIIVTSQLSEEENLWLKSLTAHLKSVSQAKKLLEESDNYKESNLYHSVMDIIINANVEKFKEAREMCNAFRELMKDELEAEREAGEKIGREAGEKIGREAGEKHGKGIGENRVNSLNMKLAVQGRTDDIIKAASDAEYQRKLFEEFGL